MAKIEYIPLTDGELEKLIRDSVEGGFHVEVAFGTGGVALTNVAGEPMSEALRRLGFMRGVLNENCNGAGI